MLQSGEQVRRCGLRAASSEAEPRPRGTKPPSEVETLSRGTKPSSEAEVSWRGARPSSKAEVHPRGTAVGYLMGR
jgi:hypothetical protein